MPKTVRIVHSITIISFVLAALSILSNLVAATLISLPIEGSYWFYETFSTHFVCGIRYSIYTLATGLFFPLCLWLLTKIDNTKLSVVFAIWSGIICCLQTLVVIIDTILSFAEIDSPIIFEATGLFPGGRWGSFVVGLFAYSDNIFETFGFLFYIFAAGCMLFVPLLCCCGFVLQFIINKKQNNHIEVV